MSIADLKVGDSVVFMVPDTDSTVNTEVASINKQAKEFRFVVSIQELPPSVPGMAEIKVKRLIGRCSPSDPG
jgi:hypothetical protein